MQLFFLPLFFFLCGIVVGGIWSGAGVFVILCSMLIFFCYHSSSRWLSIVMLCIGYALSYLSMMQYKLERDRIGESVAWGAFTQSASGVAGGLVSTSEFTYRYRVTVTEIDDVMVTPFDVALILPPNLSLVPGDNVRALGKFSFPRDTPEYRAEKQLWYRGMIGEFRSFQVQKYPPEQYTLLVRAREWFDRQLSLIFPPRGYDILSGILLGQKNTFDTEFREQLKASGLMHIMVVSGSNVMMLIVFLSLFLRGLFPWGRIVVVASVVFSFAFLVGGDAPVWRAALMGILGYSASLWGYRIGALMLPVFVAALLGLFNPLSLVYDIGLQLSFFSVICIIVFSASLTKYFRFLGHFFDEAFGLTIAATLGTLPLTLFYFGTFSLIGPLANLFAAPAVPILMYGGIVTLGASLISPSLATGIGYIPWIATTYLYDIIHIFGSPTWSIVQFELGEYREYILFFLLSLLFLGIVKSTLHSHTKTQTSL